MERYPDWQARLRAAIKAAEGRPFQYGRHDCCLAAAALVEAMTGTDLMKGWRGRYRSAAGAARLLGGKTLRATVSPLFEAAEMEAIPVALAAPGDLVLTAKAAHDACRGEALGLCAGASALFPGETGWAALPLSDCIAAWRIRSWEK